jgi:DNA topoisomerase IA
VTDDQIEHNKGDCYDAVNALAAVIQVYELVVRHFLACCSRDATGSRTNVTLQMAVEHFTANGET